MYSSAIATDMMKSIHPRSDRPGSSNRANFTTRPTRSSSTTSDTSLTNPTIPYQDSDAWAFRVRIFHFILKPTAARSQMQHVSIPKLVALPSWLQDTITEIDTQILFVQYLLPSTVSLILLSLTVILQTRLIIKFLDMAPISLSAHVQHHRFLPGLVCQTQISPPLTNRKHFPHAAVPLIITIPAPCTIRISHSPHWRFPCCFRLSSKFFCSNQRGESPGYMRRV
jgi:hypothetical protein